MSEQQELKQEQIDQLSINALRFLAVDAVEKAKSGHPGAPLGDAPIAYRLGDDVVHAAFGEGVVTGVEPGGIVVIRFSGDRSERKLVAELAPISKR